MKTNRYLSPRDMRNKKIRSLTQTQIAYLAGILDGEGCIRISRKRDRETKSGYCYRPHIHVSNTHKAMMQTIHRWTGLGNVCRFVPKAERNRRDTWQWQLWSNQAGQLIEAVLPFLIVKSRQARLLLNFIKTKRRQPGRDGLTASEWKFQSETHKQIAFMNRKGKR